MKSALRHRVTPLRHLSYLVTGLLLGTFMIVGFGTTTYADAAIANLVCTSSYHATHTGPGKYTLTIKQSYTNTGGSSTAVWNGFTGAGNGKNYSLPGTNQYFHTIPHLTHAQTYSWTSHYYLTHVTSGAWIDGFSQYAPPDHPGDARYFHACSPASHRFNL